MLNSLGCLLLAVLSLNTGCGVKKEVNKDFFEPSQIEFQLIGKGVLHGAGIEGIIEGNQIIVDEVEWDVLRGKMDISNNVSDNFSKRKIDFEKQQIIACFDKVRSSGGYTITVESVEEFSDSIVVKIERSAPTGMTTSIMTQPYYIVVIPASTKRILFE